VGVVAHRGRQKTGGANSDLLCRLNERFGLALVILPLDLDQQSTVEPYPDHPGDLGLALSFRFSFNFSAFATADRNGSATLTTARATVPY
jgi:hypothetical protein